MWFLFPFPLYLYCLSHIKILESCLSVLITPKEPILMTFEIESSTKHKTNFTTVVHSGIVAEDDCTPCIGGYACNQIGLAYPPVMCAAGYYCRKGSNITTPTYGEYLAQIGSSDFIICSLQSSFSCNICQVWIFIVCQWNALMRMKIQYIHVTL